VSNFDLLGLSKSIHPAARRLENVSASLSPKKSPNSIPDKWHSLQLDPAGDRKSGNTRRA
jgi:hypothetical protein